ncbi:hypothetical protein [Nitrosococcus wardiae]|uniref:Uncharacterized protein n=1 Tax=Nitrosococcus wardiae TaxID=1814290 RepID=A0A4P7C2M0_9GAMM|nr:hypothetical protein [Nitrosococcus wardiae]QBQ55979.1 hypothetical protein E3U44_16770 [Nitrosococcus wardiae]
MHLPQIEPREPEIDSPPQAAPVEPQGKNYFSQAMRWTLVLGIGALLAWRILVLGMAEYYAMEAPEKALAWDGRHPLALRNQAERLLESAPAQANRLLQQSLWQNPSDGRAYALLALLREKEGHEKAARQLMEQASALAPRQWPVQLEVAAFWLRQRRLDLAVQSWDVALQMRGALSKELFPALLKIAEYPSLRQALLPLARAVPPWWPAFFSYAAANAIQLETLRDLYNVEREAPPTEREREAFVARLQREGRWMEAYFTWLNALDEPALQGLGNLFNGHFEQPLSGGGFGWRFNRPRGVEINPASTYGMEGDRALRVAFFGQRVRFQHLSQPLLLAPGTYRMEGNVRLDNLETARGLQWAVCCLAPTRQLLATSERFLGASLWRRFNFSFEVPKKECTVQLLRLELLGRAPADFEARGVAWFDTLAIARIKE